MTSLRVQFIQGEDGAEGEPGEQGEQGPAVSWWIARDKIFIMTIVI